MAEKVQIDDKLVPKSQTKVEFFTNDALKGQVPGWANWAFRITIIVTTVAVFWVGGTNLISQDNKIEVMLALKTLDALVLGLSKLFGIVEK
jgi:predicted DNA repair protein MutK